MNEMKPCEWCEREDQETCPVCKGTGFVEIEEDDE
jgi:RNA polymerase subunit RPABC4/transcription elongation factor Spt4